MMNPEPKISVLMITFNHARFIRQALESVLAQKLDFSYEVVIGDDASPDGTGVILAEYAENFPDRIRLLRRAQNIGMNANFADTLAACRGEYVAVLEGDDYWTDDQKLARQAGFLDGHPECVSCFHNVMVFSDDATTPMAGYHAQPNGRQLVCAPDLPARLSQNDFFKRNYIPTCSVMFRRSSAGTLPPWFTKLHLGDQPLHILCTEHGLAAYLPEVMGTYRLHSSSVWSGKSQLHRMSRALEMYAELDRHFQGRPQQAVLWEERMDMLYEYARLLNREGQSKETGAAAATFLTLALKHPSFCVKHRARLRRMFALFCSVKIGRPTKS
jgi:glycosyltransferase involved in cell wall biosynthesis